MRYNMLSRAEKILAEQRRGRRWRKVVRALAAVVVFVTTYALILPAITMEREIICGMEEHTHTEACYTERQTFICPLKEEPGHQHTDECYRTESVLICEQQEQDGHSHSEECYSPESVLICEQQEQDGHSHSEECYEKKRVLICDQAECEGHTHTDACVQTERVLSCDLVEHIHNEDCFSEVSEVSGDPTADVESRSDWERTMAGVALTGDRARDVVAIAESQLGYAESAKNFIVTETGEVKGYTRYGAWYGSSYGAWCAMFASFCIHYAEVDGMPLEASCNRWIAKLKGEELNLYRDADTYTPSSGDLVFFQAYDKAGSGHVGLVESVTEATETAPARIRTIEGNVNNRVQYVTYDLADPKIMGYGQLPENPKTAPKSVLTASTAEGVTVTLSGGLSSFPFPFAELTLTVEELGNSATDFGGDSAGGDRAVLALETMDSALQELGVTPNEKRLFDIRLRHENEEIEPVGPVTLTFSGIETSQTTAEALVYHIDEEEKHAADMAATLNADGDIVVDTDHFSLYGVVLVPEIMPMAAGTINASMAVKSVTWDAAQNRITALSFDVSGTTRDWYYTLQHSANNGATWIPPNPTSTASGTRATANNQVITLDGASALSSLTPNSVFRVYGFKSTKAGEYGFTADLSIYQVLDTVKPGFSQWILDNYVQDFGGTPPVTIDDLYTAFGMYYAQPVALLTQEVRSGGTWLDVAVTPDVQAGEEAYTYHWQYMDETGIWQELTEEQTASINASALVDKLSGGKTVRARILQWDTLVTISNSLITDPQAVAYAAAVNAINTALGLQTYNIGAGKTADLSIGGTRFSNLFYYGNVAGDSRVPFSNAETYRIYLAETYLTEGIDAVRSVWTRYLYDLYDPTLDQGKMGNYTDYPGAATYGDGTFNWPKDGGAGPFHAAATPRVDPLDYSFLENGVDYSNFVTGLRKSATTVTPGDANTERRYNIEIVADAQAKIKAPVALVFQIQTSWQMFDLPHANRLKTDLPVNGTNIGAASYNTSLANLYDIKNALLRLVAYMEQHFPGNNLVMAISDVEHAGTFNMFSGTDSSGKSLHVTNNAATLRAGIVGWDSFGNCEHVHYGSGALQAAVANLQSNLSGWKDIYGAAISYSNIQKAAVIIGGPTENSTGTSGYGITLPWGTFQSAQLNSVYGIRVNRGTPVAGNTAGIISWIDYSGNNTGTAFQNGTGTSFTDKYVASSEDAVFNALLDIVTREMNKKSLNVDGEGVFVDNVIVNDTVTEEFFLNKNADITATILNKDGNVQSAKVLTLAGAQVQTQSDGTKITTTVDGLIIAEKPDGTTTLEYNFGTVHNTKKAVLRFQVEARGSYIGSNTVFTNVGSPELDYQYIKRDAEGNPTGVVNDYGVSCSDTPQVNVPIRFSTVNGLTANLVVGDSVNLKDLSEAIVQDAQDRVDNHPQTNGTLSYTWVLPDGTRVPAGSVTVADGSIGSASFPDRSHTFTGTVPGQYTGTLEVTFTPNPVSSGNKNFSDTATAQAVNPLMRPGNVWINVVAPDAKTDLVVKKEWPGGSEENTAVTFHLLANGTPVLEDGQPKVYTLTDAEGWTARLTGLPATQDVDGKQTVILYTVEEAPIPAGFQVSYRQETQTETVYAARATLYYAFRGDIATNQSVTITYSYGGTNRTAVLAANSHPKLNKDTVYSMEVTDLPLNESGNSYSIGIVSVVSSDGTQPSTTVTPPPPVAVKYASGTVTVPVLLIDNNPMMLLPHTGGSGTIRFTAVGILLAMTAVLLYGHKKRTSVERRLKDPPGD